MKHLAIIFGLSCLISIWCNLWVSLQIIKYLKQKDQAVSLYKGNFFVKGKIFSYLPLYKELSTKENGSPGKLYAGFYFSFIGMVLFFLLGIAAILA